MSIKIDKVMSTEEFELVLTLARKRYKNIIEAVKARKRFKKINKNKMKDLVKQLDPKDKKIIFTKKLFKEMLFKADEELKKDIGSVDSVSVLAEFLKKFQENSNDIPEIDLTFLNKIK